MSSEVEVRLRRAYDEPGTTDGYRVLVDRLWPRGRSRDQLGLDEWARDLGPSDELRRWFGHDPARWTEFQARYRDELMAPEKAAALDELARKAASGPVTLVYGARDPDHNQALVLAAEIRRRLERAAAGSR